VKAKTIDLLVPAEAEIVIEGFINTEYLEPEAPFGESHGHVNLQEFNAFMDVTAITRRRDAMLTSIISQVTPQRQPLRCRRSRTLICPRVGHHCEARDARIDMNDRAVQY
jgi:UbiD family decarboxylase